MKKSFNARHSLVALLLATFGALTTANAQSRAELLYSTHCISCHTSEMHWREKKVATDWTSLKFQVRRWQGANGLGWSEADVEEVARYLNESIYGYARPSDVSMNVPSTRP